jgi:prevent-host-death family protein
MEWKLAEAKNKFSEVINKVLLEGPQRVVRRDQAFIILEEKEYQKLTGKRQSFTAFLMSGSSLEDVDLKRDKSAMRDIGL